MAIMKETPKTPLNSNILMHQKYWFAGDAFPAIWLRSVTFSRS